MRLYYTLADYPHGAIEIECAKCGRHGRPAYDATTCHNFAGLR